MEPQSRITLLYLDFRWVDPQLLNESAKLPATWLAFPAPSLRITPGGRDITCARRMTSQGDGRTPRSCLTVRSSLWHSGWVAVSCLIHGNGRRNYTDARRRAYGLNIHIKAVITSSKRDTTDDSDRSGIHENPNLRFYLGEADLAEMKIGRVMIFAG